MEFLFKIGKKIIPQPIFKFFQPAYHWILSFLGAFFYGFPSKKLIVIGVTGTKGKTTTCNLIAQIFNSSGLKTGMATTVNFRIGEKEWINDTKQTMPGRFQLQKLLSEMVKQGCRYAVVETSSEGILQYRHRFIDYKIAVFTNLSPEHIERHGSFENYRQAKLKLFEQVAKKPNGIGIYPHTITKIINFLRPRRKSSFGVGVYNLDDKNISYFLKPKIAKQYVYTLKLKKTIGEIQNLYQVSKVKSTIQGTSFLFNNEEYKMPLIGEFNIYNAAAAICVALSQGIWPSKIKKALLKVKAPSGRFEVIESKQGFTVVIDYAHEPASLEAVYKTVIKSLVKSQKSKVICLLSSQGGGRDKWKRAEMGKIAAKYCDKIILTNEDPYDESPLKIINDIEKGIRTNQRNRHKSAVYKIIDRKKAIKAALSLAKKGDVVILTGKGGEVWMCVENDKKIPWDEKKIVEEELIKLIH
jgi:UDP-N-acetylmuramoyl-L-alanyl-D-glutamate--2,6-diaminopimelate ligase